MFWKMRKKRGEWLRAGDAGALLCRRSRLKGEAAESDGVNIMLYVRRGENIKQLARGRSLHKHFARVCRRNCFAEVDCDEGVIVTLA